MTLAGARRQNQRPGERREGVYPVGSELEFPAWVAFSLFVTFALVGAVAAGGVAHENGRRWWIWAPLGALFAIGPQILVPLLEGTPLYRDSPITTLHGVIAVTCAAWCGYLARSKQRRVWLWIVLGAVFAYIALIIVAVLPGRGETLLEETLSARIARTEDAARFVARARGRATEE